MSVMTNEDMFKGNNYKFNSIVYLLQDEKHL